MKQDNAIATDGPLAARRQPGASRQTVRTADEYGRKIVRVPLAKGRGEAVIDQRDFDLLMRIGVSPAWFLNGTERGRYVRTSMRGIRGSLVGVARVITRARRGQIVKYRDGNRLNLRRGNLKVASGRSNRTDAVEIVRAAVARAAGDPETVGLEGRD